jgi:glycosyltransferase involved in cell wall biosynthesis
MYINPLISIVIPVFNRVEYIEDAIISAVNQTYKNIEIIVVDNKSTDGTYEKIIELNKKFKLRVHQNEKNYGRVENWNIGLHLAKGDFVQYLMSDDLLIEDCIKTKVELLNKYHEKNIVIVNSAFLKVPSNIVVSSYKDETFFDGKKAYYDVTINGSWMNGPNDNMINLAIAKICGGV